MHKKLTILISLTFILWTGTTLSAFAQAPTAFERDRGRTMLTMIKADLKKHYYDADFHGMDVDARFKAAEEKMKEATSQGQILGIIAQVLADLDDSHTYFVPPGKSSTVEYGWQMQMIGDKCFVVAVKPGSNAETVGLKEGDEIVSIDGIGPIRQNFWKIQYSYQALRPRAGMRLVVVKPDGNERQLDVMAKVTEGKRVVDLTDESGNDFADLIRQQENQERLDSHRYYELGEDLMIWKMPAFDLGEAKVDEMLGRAKKRKALVLDLRGNGGGYETTLLRMISNVFDRDIKLGDVKRRKEIKHVIAKTRGGNDVFPGKLVVLIDSKSGSAAELFARIVQLEKRGTVIGDVSSGAVMRARSHRHEVGVDTVVFFGASVTDADIVMTDGKSLERVGVVPDELKVPTPQHLAGKLDPVLSYAASLVGVKISPEKAGSLFPIEWRK